MPPVIFLFHQIRDNHETGTIEPVGAVDDDLLARVSVTFLEIVDDVDEEVDLLHSRSLLITFAHYFDILAAAFLDLATMVE